MKRLALLWLALLCAASARGALSDASGAPVTAATPFGDVDGETGTVGDLLALAPVTTLAPATNYVDASVAAATNGLLRAEADPAFRAWTNGTEVAAGAGAVAAHESVAIGSRASTSDEIAPLYVGAVAVGPDSDARGHGSVAVGKEAKATDAGSVALGPGARSHGAWTVSVNADGPDKFYLGDRSLRSFMDAGLAAKQDRPAATAAADALSFRADGAAISVAVAASGTLSADLSGWTDGQAQTALVSLAPGATVADGVRLAGYGSWPTNRFLASCVRVGARVYVVPVAALAE